MLSRELLETSPRSIFLSHKAEYSYDTHIFCYCKQKLLSSNSDSLLSVRNLLWEANKKKIRFRNGISLWKYNKLHCLMVLLELITVVLVPFRFGTDALTRYDWNGLNSYPLGKTNMSYFFYYICVYYYSIKNVHLKLLEINFMYNFSISF